MTKNKKGFTIIEVVLVLAIAGLIFLMVFIALPALQRSQRNTRRRQDMARILSAFTEFASNNNGSMPTSDTQLKSFVEKYASGVTGCTATVSSSKATAANCGDQFTDPDGSSYSLAYKGDAVKDATTFTNTETFASVGHEIRYYSKASCGDENTQKEGNGSRDIAIYYLLEGGAIYCGDNH